MTHLPLSCVFGTSGKDSRRFLQNICTNDVSNLRQPHDAMFTCWLTPKGRTVCETFVSLLDTIKVRTIDRQGASAYWHVRTDSAQ